MECHGAQRNTVILRLRTPSGSPKHSSILEQFARVYELSKQRSQENHFVVTVGDASDIRVHNIKARLTTHQWDALKSKVLLVIPLGFESHQPNAAEFFQFKGSTCFCRRAAWDDSYSLQEVRWQRKHDLTLPQFAALAGKICLIPCVRVNYHLLRFTFDNYLRGGGKPSIKGLMFPL